MTGEKLTLEEVVRDSKDLLDPALMGVNVAWQATEAKLLARVEAEAEARRSRARYAGRRRLWGGAAMGLALAASVPLFVAHRQDRTPSLDGVAQEALPERSAGALVWKEGRGEVRIGAEGSMANAAPGSPLAQGDAAEAHDVKGFFRRDDTVTWALEDGARVVARGTRGALVLALDRGAVEAQVTPVPAGEAFAVDIEGARVAVHGTHLRVSRAGTRVTVDLTEGVVSIGTPPRTGSTFGELVNAPAHIEFDANDPKGTLQVTHDPARVRAALALRPPAENVVAVSPRMAVPPPASPPPFLDSKAAARGIVPPAAALSVPRTSASAHRGEPRVVEPGAVAKLDTHPEQTIAQAVLACARGDNAVAGDHPANVVITVSSRLVLHVGDDGVVQSARFEPPLTPEVQACAARSIYAARFPAAGDRTIPLDFQR